ncbi:hypothetical protein AUJ27_02095 [Candidatus Falkowbacteria bacterium CG1_02_37_44]|uniref:Thymidylate kinase-like domain-containing protein n=1 Tax=Candidatus Falkowbacteria bacterium CG1_02_37_44 TaxID=1805146 RepID=A0A1J4T855_9BACT|nr:MAG: hypothetical protein AUJ27_02095 [Candidatus Falkowbacteria bacterium CG1_02_37_44]
MSKSNKHLFIVIEGVDGSGKTTVGEKLAEEINAVFYQTPSKFWRKKRNIVENSNVVIRFFYYFIATIFSTVEIRKILKTESVICDRYVYSTWAYHIVYGFSLLRFVSPFLIFYAFQKPDKAYYLYVSRTERENRISNRSKNTLKDRDSDTLKKTQEEFIKFSDLVIIDTSNINVEKVVNLITKDLGSGK